MLTDQQIGEIKRNAVDCTAGDIYALVDEVRRLRDERDKLQRFKDYVHARLDAAGVSANPDSPHKAEGCRVGGRLDELIGERDRLRASAAMARTLLADLPWDVAEALVQRLTDPDRWAQTSPDIQRDIIETYLPTVDPFAEAVRAALDGDAPKGGAP